MTTKVDGPNLETSRKALIQFMARLKEFRRGGRGSSKFNDIERVECLSDASYQLFTAKEGILAHPRCMEIQWMVTALQVFALADSMFRNIPPFPCTERDTNRWVQTGGLTLAYQSLAPFWAMCESQFEIVLVHLQNNHEAKKVSQSVPKNKAQKALLRHMLKEGFDSTVNTVAIGDLVGVGGMSYEDLRKKIPALRTDGLLEVFGNYPRFEYYLSPLGIEVANYIDQQS